MFWIDLRDLLATFHELDRIEHESRGMAYKGPWSEEQLKKSLETASKMPDSGKLF
jgi:hypothetical protein